MRQSVHARGLQRIVSMMLNMCVRVAHRKFYLVSMWLGVTYVDDSGMLFITMYNNNFEWFTAMTEFNYLLID